MRPSTERVNYQYNHGNTLGNSDNFVQNLFSVAEISTASFTRPWQELLGIDRRQTEGIIVPESRTGAAVTPMALAPDPLVLGRVFCAHLGRLVREVPAGPPATEGTGS
ncbi:hypothetical protein E2C01_056286 [Portunus trituberculatus]|uniref:Uncharacterized protein n=1 Tax=Portunus trituberculatus TaxID=210409 RepID=A0A5B7GWZ0_PORTR|nr:hypothetical protein [Portunus trituberculatus]